MEHDGRQHLRLISNLLHKDARNRQDLSVSNSVSGRHWKLDQIPAVGDPTHIVQVGSGPRVAAIGDSLNQPSSELPQ